MGAGFLPAQEEQDPVALGEHRQSHDAHCHAIGGDAARLADHDAAASDEPLQHLLDPEQVVGCRRRSIRAGLHVQNFAEDDDGRPVDHALVRWYDVDDGACRRGLKGCRRENQHSDAQSESSSPRQAPLQDLLHAEIRRKF